MSEHFSHLTKYRVAMATWSARQKVRTSGRPKKSRQEKHNPSEPFADMTSGQTERVETAAHLQG